MSVWESMCWVWEHVSVCESMCVRPCECVSVTACACVSEHVCVRDHVWESMCVSVCVHAHVFFFLASIPPTALTLWIHVFGWVDRLLTLKDKTHISFSHFVHCWLVPGWICGLDHSVRPGIRVWRENLSPGAELGGVGEGLALLVSNWLPQWRSCVSRNERLRRLSQRPWYRTRSGITHDWSQDYPWNFH